MVNNEHSSVLLKEVINLLIGDKNGVYVDCTFGRGGHSQAILAAIAKSGKLFAIDQDEAAIKAGRKNFKKYENFFLIKNNFVNLKAILSFYDIYRTNGILYDLGVSSPQLDDQSRGFSYRFDAKLDMRMDQTQALDAKMVVNEKTAVELTEIIRNYGEEKFATKISAAIVNARKLKEISTTFELVEIIKSALPEKIKRLKKHPAKKTFQAIRIYVNDEINALQISLEQAVSLLKLNGRLVIITFHSLEEKIINNLFKKLTYDEHENINKYLPVKIENKIPFKVITKKPIVVKDDELQANNRSHSAKLWAIERIGYE